MGRIDGVDRTQHLAAASLRRLACAVLPTLMMGGILACTAGPPDESLADPVRQVLDAHAGFAYLAYSQSRDSAAAMTVKIEEFAAAPSERGLALARSAWIEARKDYGVTEAFRFSSGPIDAQDGPEALLNSWPVDESYLDGVVGAPDGGIIQNPDAFPVLDRATLISLNERGGEENVATGWHAIEFLLWGQDLSVDGPGQRPLTDFTSDRFARRRLDFLTVTSNLLVSHLETLVQEWAPDSPADPGNYRTEFLDLDRDEALRRVLSGLVEMTRGEIAGERLVVSLETRSEQDEQSCFSDTTTNDIVANVTGVASVLTTGFAGDRDASLLGLVRAADPVLAADLTSTSTLCEQRSAAIPAPFDQHLRPAVAENSEGRQVIRELIDCLEKFASDLERAAALDLTRGDAR